MQKAQKGKSKIMNSNEKANRSVNKPAQSMLQVEINGDNSILEDLEGSDENYEMSSENEDEESSQMKQRVQKM